MLKFDDDRDTTRLEGSYVHCKQCLEEIPEDEDYTQKIEVIYSGAAVQVWCNKHECNVATFYYRGVSTRT